MSLLVKTKAGDTLKVEFNHQPIDEVLIQVPFINRRGDFLTDRSRWLAAVRKCTCTISLVDPARPGNLKTLSTGSTKHNCNSYIREVARQKSLTQALITLAADSPLWSRETDTIIESYENRPRPISHI